MSQTEVKSKQIQALISVLGLVTWLVLGRMIGDNGIAYFAVATEGFMIFYVLLTGRLEESLGRLLRSRYAKGQFKNGDKVKQSVLIFQTVIGALGGLLLFFLAPVIAEKVFLLPYGMVALRILSVVLLIRVVSHIILGIFQGSGTQMPTIVVSFLRTLFYLGFTFLFVRMFREYGEKVSLLLLNDLLPSMYGAAGMAVAVTVTELLLLLFVICLYLISRNTLKKQTEGLKNTETFPGAIGGLYVTMSPPTLLDVLVRLPIWLGMLFYVRSVENVQVAAISYGKYYGKYLVVCMIPILCGDILLHSLAAGTAKAMRKREHRYGRGIFEAGFHMGVVITLFPVIFFTVLSTQINHLIEGTKGVPGELGKMFLIGSTIIVFAVLSLFFVRCLLYMGKWNMVFGALGLYVIIFVVSVVIFFNVMKLTVDGLIYAGLAALLVLCLSTGIYLFRYLRVKPDMLHWIAIPIGACAASGLICYLLGKYLTPYMGYPFTVILAFVVGLLIYWVILLALKNFHRQELEVIPGGELIERLLELF
ncbi:MAG: oligosaccharide flippase family protein [Lachnospiraceae bacterium]|nr:oligosaccharide flippase family protein [Lachnospiraceae bacterium]